MKQKPVDEEKIISDIMKGYPESEWLDRCRKALPTEYHSSIMPIIEILSGGDVKEI